MEDKLYSECRKVGTSAILVTKLSNDHISPHYAIDVNRSQGNAWDQQRITVGWKGLLAIHRLIEPLVDELKKFEQDEKEDASQPKQKQPSPI